MSRRTIATALRILLVVLLASVVAPAASPVVASRLAAQGNDPLASALTAYRDLEFDAAATRLRAAIALTGANRLSDENMERALMYLGATEHFRDRRDAAMEAFRTLLLANARYRPNELTFPPEVAALFQETRIGVRSVIATLPPESVLRDAGDRLVIRLYASSVHQVQATVRAADGLLVGQLHDGAIGDSLDLVWDARQERGRLRTTGRYLLRIASLSPEGRAERELDIPLDLSWDAVDTLPLPAEPAYRPETAPPRGRFRPLTMALLVAGVAAIAPEVAGGGEVASSMRFGVVGVLGAAGVAGAVVASRPIPLADNIAQNRADRTRWEAEATRIRDENDRRRSVSTLRVRAGRPLAVEVR